MEVLLGNEGDEVGQERLRPDVTRGVWGGFIQDEESGFHAVAMGSY